MNVFLSVFKKEKCRACNRKFVITMKRRECKICSNIYLEHLFCTACSIKIRKPKTFSYDRYCLSCHGALARPKTILVDKPAKNLMTSSMAINNDYKLNYEDNEQERKKIYEEDYNQESKKTFEEEVKPAQKKINFLDILKKRVSKILVKFI